MRGVARLLQRSEHPRWLSNTWLVADRPGGHAVLVDAGGPPAPILAALAEHGLTLTHVLLTHHHHDHVEHAGLFAERFGAELCGHAAERARFGRLDRELADGEELASGDLRVRALHVPGHTVGQLAFVVDEARVFTGDTLFRRSVGGTRGPGHASFEELRASILERLLTLPPDMPVHPGHTLETTIGEEREENPFVRLWRGLDTPANRPCTALGRPATLLLRATDYDGGTKCHVRFDEGGAEDVVPGSRVEERQP